MAKGMIDEWLRMNGRNMRYLLILPLLLLAGDGVILLQGSSLPKVFDREEWLTILEFFIIPAMAVNAAWAGGRLAHQNGIAQYRQIFVKGAACMIGALIGTAIMETIYAHYGIVDDDQIVIGSIRFSPTATNFITNGILAVVISIPIFISQNRHLESRLALQNKALKLNKAEKQHAEARLEALQSKLNPHFLFNSLNSIASLVYTQPQKAEQMITGLSELFRYNLQSGASPWSTIGEEIKIIETYLNIERIRFEGNLEFSLTADPELYAIPLPRFLLQPIVENAVIHGTSKITNGHIGVQVKSEGQEIVITIEDNGPPFRNDLTTGIGLSSTTEKLELLYPSLHSFQFYNDPQKETQIRLMNS